MAFPSTMKLDGFGEVKKDDLCATVWLRWWFDNLWWISPLPLAVILILSLVFGIGNPFTDWVFITFGVLLGIEWWLFRYMLYSVPRDMNLLADSGRLKRRDTQTNILYAEDLHIKVRWGLRLDGGRWKLNLSFWQIASAGAIGLMIVYIILFNDSYNWLGELYTSLIGKGSMPMFFSGLVGGVVPLFWALPIGAGIWVVVAIGLSLSQLTQMFEFDPIPGHPDGCGGLGKLGDICLRMGLLSILPQFVTLLIYVEGKKINTDSIVVLMAGFVSFIFALLAIPCFVLPMWRIHQEMKRRCTIYEKDLAQKIVEAENELREYFHPAITDKNELNKSNLEAIQKKIDTLQKLSSKARDFPTWPFSTRLTLVVSSNLLIPLATFILPNLPQPIKELIAGLINVGGKA